MSYTTLIPFRNGIPVEGIEFQNAWGGAARIWSALFDKYIKDPSREHHSWLFGNQQPLWALASNSKLPMHERAVHAFTFDRWYVKRENFKRFAADLRAFGTAYPVAGVVNHLPAWADAIEQLDAEAVGLHGTSVTENPWFEYYPETDEPTPVPLSAGHEVYETLEAK